MKKRVRDAVIGSLCGLVIGIALIVAAPDRLLMPALAQAPAATASAAVQTLDEGEKLLVQIVALQAQLAQCQADQLESMRQFTQTRAAVVKQIESKHPGYTLDLQTGKMVAKAPAK